MSGNVESYTAQQAIDRLNALTGDDTECDHSSADGILLAALRGAGLGTVADAWDSVYARSGGFWYA